jgi:hypothetical protein
MCYTYRNLCDLIEKGKPAENQGRKAMGLQPTGHDCQAAKSQYNYAVSIPPCDFWTWQRKIVKSFCLIIIGRIFVNDF